ncbi:hypothetical protein AB26_4363 [Escherichia coli 2-011-08_S1_C2]|nr:hypothetical protein AB26_4363 [Escherichia coli 2-011-08_S1_C2]
MHNLNGLAEKRQHPNSTRILGEINLPSQTGQYCHQPVFTCSSL